MVANAEAITAARTATGLRNPIVDNAGGVVVVGIGAASPCTAGSASLARASISGSSRWGLPHLWQKRASSGSLAPHVQNSFTNLKCRMQRARLFLFVNAFAQAGGHLAAKLYPISRYFVSWLQRPMSLSASARMNSAMLSPMQT